MGRYLTLLLLVFAAACGGRDGFTAAERRLTGNDPEAGMMRVLTVDDREDSLFLRRRAVEIDSAAIRSRTFGVLCRRMQATVTDPSQDGVGIAAPQVGVGRRVIAVQRVDLEGAPFRFYVNPELEAEPPFEAGGEGCLSIPGRKGYVVRSQQITINYNDPQTFERVSERVSGFAAVIFQHEIDHLDGKLYIDFLTDKITLEE